MWSPVDINGRLNYIDTLRAFLMSYGIIMHAGKLLHNDVSSAIGHLSNIFRMETFFVVAGFFTALVFTKSLSQRTFLKRLYSLLMPFTFFLILFNPFAYYVLCLTAGADLTFKDFLLHGPPNFGDESGFGISWHLHLWFLLVLALFTCLYIPLAKILKSAFVVKILDTLLSPYKNPALSFALVAVAIGCLSVLLRSLYFLSVEKHSVGHPFNHMIASFCLDLPFFILGLAIFFFKPLFDLFHQLNVIPLLILGTIMTILISQGDALTLKMGEAPYELALRTVKAICSVYTAGFLFKSFSMLFHKPNKISLFLSDAAYTVYLLHLYILIGFFYFFYDKTASQPGMYIIAIIVTYAMCLAIHAGFVSRFEITRSLMNGKLSSGKEKIKAGL